MEDTFSADGNTYTIRSWDGGRLNTEAHGPGALVGMYGSTRQCTLNHGVISGYCWYTDTYGHKYAQVYNTQGMLHGSQVVFWRDGDIRLRVFNDGKQEKYVEGMMCIQYI